MADLWTKVNALIRAKVEGFLEEDLHLPLRGRADRMGQNIDAEIAALRGQIDKALEREDKLEADIATLRDGAADWDARADNALLEGDEATARQALAQMQKAERQAAFLESDLAQHRRNTADFITRVNMLEGIVADARRQDPEDVDDEAETSPPEPPRVVQTLKTTLDSVLQTARREIETLETEEANLASVEDQVRETVEGIQVEDDLAARRTRLARRGPAEEEG